MQESRAVEILVYDTLRNYVPLASLLGGRIYVSAPPPNAQFSYVVQSPRSNVNVAPLDANRQLRVQTTYRYNILVHTLEGETYDLADEIAHYVDEALNGASALLTVFTVPISVDCVGRTDDIKYASRESDIRYNYVGGVYDFIVSPQ